MEAQRAREDFDSARFKAFRRAVLGALRPRARALPGVDAVMDAAGVEGQAFAGVHEIPLAKIVGSAAGTAKGVDFDRAFLPVNRRLRDRWTRIYTAMVEGGELPPIDVYKLDDTYYVIDGHHRVSVARSLGRDSVNARVVEVRTRAPIGEGVDRYSLLRAREYADFLQVTALHRTRPDARLEGSRLGRYDELLKHILGHRYFLGLERNHEVTLEEAAAHWYDTVYLPVAHVIRAHDVLAQFPGTTEADVYVEITRRWLRLSEEGKPSGPDPAAASLLAEDARRWWQRRRAMS